MVPESQFVSEGELAFALQTPQLWNSLPGDQEQENSVSSLESLLETDLSCHLVFVIENAL